MLPDPRNRAMTLNEILGQRFGRYTVIARAENNRHKQARWLCRCDCGTERVVLGYSLTSGHTQSCGCLARERTSKAMLRDLTGQQFGKLSVIERAGSDRRKQAMWLCRCDCGKMHTTRGRLLVRGDTSSCGCLRAAPELKGQRFGRLMVLKKAEPTARGETVWLCECDCGKVRKVRAMNLVYGTTKSCGCFARDGVSERNQKGLQDLTGQRFGRAVVVALASRQASGQRPRTRWRCQCDCGKTFVALRHNLTNGDIQSCGCYKHDSLVQRLTKHGLSAHPLAMTWHGIVRRCTNPRDKDYGNYGARGISIFPRWLGESGLANFIADLERDIGPRPAGCTIDRADNMKGYQPGNLRWATVEEQNANRRPMKRLDQWPLSDLRAELHRRGVELPATPRLCAGQTSRAKQEQPSVPKPDRRPKGAVTKHPRYKTWAGVRARCTKPSHKQYKHYGGRGISLHAPWINDPAAFVAYLDEVLGLRPEGHSLDRIDNDKGYEPGNLRWAEARTQIHNRRPRKRLDAWATRTLTDEVKRRMAADG